MITVELKGGLGNMMFQIATIEYIAKNIGTTTYYYNLTSHFKFLYSLSVHSVYKMLENSYEYVNIFKNIKLFNKIETFTNIIEAPFNYIKLEEIDNTCYSGFFQSEKYFNDKNFIWALFEPVDKIKKELEKYKFLLDKNTCSVHIRRGDYLNLKDIHPVQQLSYYHNAINYMKDIDLYLIFSDDVEWCKNNFKIKNAIYIENEKDYVELFLQSKCKHNIIANSSFSWWGAWLNQNPNKIIIGPKKWFENNQFSDIDIIPTNWIKM